MPNFQSTPFPKLLLCRDILHIHYVDRELPCVSTLERKHELRNEIIQFQYHILEVMSVRQYEVSL